MPSWTNQKWSGLIICERLWRSGVIARTQLDSFFGRRNALTLEEKVLRMLTSEPNGLKLTEISEQFQRHRSGLQITFALENLRDQGLVNVERLGA
jgi:hypothetical protein